jgi:hypothetical protein
MAAAAIKLIVAADEPALFYSSVDAATTHLEWIDVEDGVYPIAYDPDGNIYRLRTEGQRVVIERDMNSPPDPHGLNALLQKATRVKSVDNAFLLTLCTRRIDD